MTKRTVTNQDRFVSTRGTGDFAVATEADECLVNGKPKKFENWATSNQLTGGTTSKTTIAGEPIWTKPGKLGPPSLPDHPGTLGKKSGKPAHGEAEAITTSGNLKAEGEPVVRLKDKTHQNRKNTLGEVMPELKRFNFEDAAGADGGAHADSGGTRGGTKNAKDAQVVAGDGAFPPSGTVPVEHCNVQAVRATCEHRSRPSQDGLLQVVVPRGARSHSVILEASVDGPCLAVPDHPHWTTDAVQIPPGRLTKVAVEAPGSDPIQWRSGRGFDQLSDRVPKSYLIRCVGCGDARHQLKVDAYDPGLFVLDVDRTKNGDTLTRIMQGVSLLMSLLVDGAEMGAKPEGGNSHIDVLHGKASCVVRVKEFTDYRVFVELDLEFDFKPFFQLTARISIVDLIVHIVMFFATGAMGNLAVGGAKAVAKVGKAASRFDGLVKGGANWLVDGAASTLRKSRLTAGLGEKIATHGDKLKDMLAKRLDFAFKPPADIYFDINSRLDVEGHLARSTPSQERPVALKQPVATFKYTVGLGGDARTVMGGGALELSFELIITVSATTSARATIGLDAGDKLVVQETELTSEPALEVSLCSPFGEFTPEALKVPSLKLSVNMPSTIVFPDPSVSR